MPCRRPPPLDPQFVETVKRFVRERCRVAPNAKTRSCDLWSAWRVWSVENDLEEHTEKEFTRALIQCGARKAGLGVHQFYLHGIEVKQTEDRALVNTVRQFVAAECFVDGRKRFRLSVLYAAFEKWLTDRFVEVPSQPAFTIALHKALGHRGGGYDPKLQHINGIHLRTLQPVDQKRKIKHLQHKLRVQRNQRLKIQNAGPKDERYVVHLHNPAGIDESVVARSYGLAIAAALAAHPDLIPVRLTGPGIDADIVGQCVLCRVFILEGERGIVPGSNANEIRCGDCTLLGGSVARVNSVRPQSLTLSPQVSN